MKLNTTNRSVLSSEAQSEVDKAIAQYGLSGIGYFYVRTCCPNCQRCGVERPRIKTNPVKV